MTPTASNQLITNSLTQKKEAFVALNAPNVSMYVCGVTVYDHSHIGHARAYIAFDIIRRQLQHHGYTVTYIQNFTDIDDKIIKKAADTNRDYTEITATYTESYLADMAALNVLPATQYPKATDHITQMHTLIQTLLDKHIAYVADNGDVYFDVSKFEDYGKLSKKVLDELEAGHRVEIDVTKHTPLDFVLWKQAKPGEPSWDSPWGAGRPGWHIECSAMALHHLGDTIDIHGGGEDLRFPHHENEIAQSESCTHKPFARYWVHNGFVTIDNTKMSKSLGNTTTIKELRDNVSGEVIRFYLLKTHYRHPFNFSTQGLLEAKAALKRLHHASLIQDTAPSDDSLLTFETRFNAALNDDFNAAEGIGVLFELVKHINTTGSGATLLKILGDRLGLFYNLPTQALPDELQILFDARLAARQSKDFATSDKLRDELMAAGVLAKDSADGTSWEWI